MPAAAFAALLALLAALVATCDLDRYIIPDSASAAIFLAGLALCLVEAPDGVVAALADALARAAVAGLFFWLLRWLYHRLRGVFGIGLGDVKLAAATAPWLDWTGMPLALELAAIAAIVAVGLTALRRRESIRGATALPFGAFLAPAAWVTFVGARAGLFAFG
jgi:leader peptidase (prepilin peptidase)/N-methyltransferase